MMSFVVPSSTKLVKQHSKLEYEEMKRRLIETEQKLDKLKKLDEDLESVVSANSDRMSSVSEHISGTYSCHDSPRVDSESGQSAISTVPDSYTRFVSHKVCSSTPSKHKRAVITKDADSCDSDSPANLTRANIPANKYERKLLSQNQRLLAEVERLVDELHTVKLQVASSEKYEAVIRRVPDLEDRIEGLQAESQAQDKALREAEKHIEEGARRNADLHMKLEKYEGDLADLHMELEAAKSTKKQIECQRDEALQSLMEAQDSLGDYQRRMKDKIKKMEAAEDELRDSLASVTQERDDLMEQLSDMQTSLASQEAQINRLLTDLENEDMRKREVEQEKITLQDQLHLLMAQLIKYESDAKGLKAVKKEKQLLEAELTEHRSMAQELSQLLTLAQHCHSKNVLEDSGNYSIHNAKNDGVVWSAGGDAAAMAELNTNNNGSMELNTNNNGLGCEGGTTMMGELRNLFTNMDGEIQRLRYDLKQRDADDRTYQNLHDELRVLMDKVESGVRANQELECLVSSLEEDKRNLLIKLDECHQTIAERERQIQCMDTRLNERNHQVICLQEDNNDKAQTICQLSKQLDCNEQRLQMSESGQDQCAEHVTSLEARIKELEDILCQKEQTVQDLSEQIVKINKEFRCMQQKYDKKVDCLNQQIYEYQKQIEQLTSDNDSLNHKLTICSKSFEDCKRMLHAQEDRSQCFENTVDELRTTLDEKEKLHCKLLESYQQKICKSNDQIKGLDINLAMCRNEVKIHMDNMEKVKNHFECEIMKKDSCIKHLKEELRKCSEDLKCRVQENCSLEQTNAELHNKLSNTYAQLKACEQNACCLSDKLKNMENIMLKDKACYMKETEELERRLSQALNNLQCSHEEINKLKAAVSEKSGMIDCLQGEKNSLCRDLTKCKEVACTLQDKLNKMERDNQELCRQLQQKMDCIRDLEVAICAKEQEVKCCQRCVEELQEKIKRLNSVSISSNCSVQNLQEKLKCCREELLYLTKKYNETEDALKRCQLDIRDKCEEIRLLNCTIEEISCRLHERVARVDELEKAIENLNKDIEKRMKRVDEQLKKYECELCDKAKQIADIDDCLSRCQHSLNEKCNEACLLEQKNTRLCSDLNACNAKLKESEDARECLGKALSEQRGETAELSQELRVTRDQLQQKHQELMDCQQTLCSTNREWEKCRRDCDDLRNTLTQRECELQHLNEEKNCLVSKVAHLTCRLENETCQLQNQLAETKCRLEKENESLRIYQAEVEENNACLLQKLGACQRQLSQMEKCCYQKLDCMNREIEDLNSKLADREDQIAQCKECLQLRNSEIMRLKLKLCNADSCCPSNRTCNNNYPDLTDSSAGSFEQDNVESPTVLSVARLPEWTLSHLHVDTGQALDKPDAIEEKHNRQGDTEDSQLTLSTVCTSLEDSLHAPHESSTAAASSTVDHFSPHSSIGVCEVREQLHSNELIQKEMKKGLHSLVNSRQDPAQTSSALL
ncbi:hypothetical protein BsWGS_08610 [Bradybaena similaris]